MLDKQTKLQEKEYKDELFGTNIDKKGSIKRFLKYFKPWPIMSIFLIDSLFAVILGGTSVGLPFLTKFITAQAEGIYRGASNDFFWLIFSIGMLGVLLVVNLFSQWIVTCWGHMMGIKMEINMRREIINKMHKLKMSFFDKTPTGSFISRMVGDLRDIPEFAHHAPEDFIIALVTFGGGFTFAFMQSWIIGVAFGGIFIIGLVIIYFVRIKWRVVWEAQKENNSKMSASIGRQVEGITEIKSFASEKEESKHYEELQCQYWKINRRFYQVEGYATVSSVFITMSSVLLSLAAGGILLAKKMIDFPIFVGLTTAASVINQPIQRFVAVYTMLARGAASITRFFEFLALEEEVNTGTIIAKNLKGNIEFRNVSFSYDTGQGKTLKVLENFSLKIAQGEKIAFVGETGIGKSTILKLILRFYDIQDGEILVDGIDIREFELHSYRQQIGYIQQSPTIFDESLIYNITYGRPDASASDVNEVARKAFVDEFVSKTDNGYNTVAGPRGAKLSGGQKQRVSIARTMLMNSPVLLLDEATSSLDNETEEKIKKSINNFSQNKTMLVVAHRLTTIRDVDRVIVIGRGGHIIESGTFTELASRKGGQLNRLNNIY